MNVFNVELRGGKHDGAMCFNIGDSAPGRVIRVPDGPPFELNADGTIKLVKNLPETLYIVTMDHNKNGDLVADIKHS